MATFNFNRFSQALRCHLMVTRKATIRLFGIYTLVMLMANLFFTRISFNHYDDKVAEFGLEQTVSWYNNYVEQSSVFAFFFLGIAMLIGASMLFRQMKTTPQRSAYLTWPVSHLEKYVIALLEGIVLTFFMTIVAAILADALRVLIDATTGRAVIWGFTKPFEGFSKSSVSEEWQNVWMVFSWMFYIHSLYIVGGTLFRRQQFLFTSGTIAVVTILLVMILNQVDINIHFMTGTWDEKTYTYTRTYYPAFYVLFTVLDLLIVFHYWASYKLFCRMQVINNKWLNV